MAYTKVFPVTDRLKRIVDYATNQIKTGLDGVIKYAVDLFKTEKRLFQSALNVENIDTAYKEMQATKKKWNKTDGRLAYHFIQSFKPNEVTPEQAHRIGVEFARACFGNRYEVVIGTHLDRNHLHNHIVINSVSFVDGKKYHSSPESYYNTIRGTSDSLCRENNLSVIDPQGHGKHYAEWKAEQDGKPTINSQIYTAVKKDIDKAIRQSFTFNNFIESLRKQGYYVKHSDTRKYISIKPPFADGFIRLNGKKLGAEYTEEYIKKRIAEQQQKGYKKLPVMKSKKIYRIIGKIGTPKKLHGFKALYFRYLYMLGAVKKRKTPPKISAHLRSEIIKLQKYSKQFRFMLDNDIETVNDLTTYKNNVISEIDELTERRKPLYYQRRVLEDETEIAELSAEIDEYTKELRTLRGELRMCSGIEENAPAVNKRLQEVDEIKNKQEKELIKNEPSHSRSRPSSKTRLCL